MHLTVTEERWPIRGRFAISRESRTEARVVVATLTAEGRTGRGECVPYPRYGESVEGVMADIEAMAPRLAEGLDRQTLRAVMPAGAARNAIDCALWDLEAKAAGLRAWVLAGLPAPEPAVTAATISVGEPDVVGEEARKRAGHPLLKVKLGDVAVVESLTAVRENAPAARLIVDANEAWTPELLADLGPELQRLGVEMVEQPLPAGEDAALADIRCPVPLCADESCHGANGVAALADRYRMVNIKLDKTGGLTEALAVRRAAEDAGLGVMIGCMVGTSLAMAPATLLTPHAAFVDLDGPLILDRDRDAGLSFEDGRVHPPTPALWG